MMEKKKIQISYNQQKYCSVMMGLGFFLIFVAYSPIQAIITQIYESFGHQHFGPITLAIIYIAYALSTSFASPTLKRYGYKKVFIFGSLCYSLFQCSGLIIYLYGQNVIIAWLAVSIPALLCGLSAGLIWVAFSSYIGEVSQLQYRDEMYGVALGMRSFSVMLGFWLNMQLLTRFTEDVYFTFFILIGMISLLFFYFLPYTAELEANFTQEVAPRPIPEVIANYFKLLAIQQNREIYSYCIMEGLTNSFCTVMLYFVSFNSMPEAASLTSEEYQHLQKYYLGVFLFFYGLPQGFMGFLMKPIAKWINCYQIAYYATLISFLLMIATLVVFYLGIFWIDCVIAFFWGVILTVHRSNTPTLTSKHFNNSLQMFGVQQFIGAMAFASAALVLSLLLKLSTLLTFCLLILIYFVVTKDAWTFMHRNQLETTERLIQMHEKL